MKPINETLQALGFPSPLNVEGRSSLDNLIPEGKRCGIYVLHLPDDAYYCGQSRDVVRRYNQHRRRFGDIPKVSFKPVPQRKLNEVEVEIIHSLETAGYFLRNRRDVDIIADAVPFDDIMPKAEQQQWKQQVNQAQFVGREIHDFDLRRRYTEQYQKYTSLSGHEEVTQILREYVHVALPPIPALEYHYWSCSCLPYKGVYARINIYFQEVLTVYPWRGAPLFSFHLSKAPLRGMVNNFRLHVGGGIGRIWTSNHRYKPGGLDQKNVLANGAGAAHRLLANPDFVHALRDFNLRLMRKGTNINKQSHCLDLADKLVE